MRMLRGVPGVLIALGILSVAPAHAATQQGKTTLRGWLGFSTLALGDINDQIRSQRDDFLADTLLDEAKWDPLGGAPNLGFELEVQLTPVLSAGLGFSSQRGSRRHQAFLVYSRDPDTGEPSGIESFDEDIKFSAWDVVGTLGLWVPSAPGLHFGAQLGLARGTFESQATHLFDTGIELPFLQVEQGDWRGTGVVLGAFTGYEQPLSSALSLCTRMGYRYRNIRRPDGVLRTTHWGDTGNERQFEPGPLMDADGNPMELDLGGFYFNLGLSLGFGARE